MPSTHLSSLRRSAGSFAALDQRLREDSASDGDAQALRTDLTQWSQRLEVLLRARRARVDSAALLQRLPPLQHALRQHQRLLSGLGSAWHALPEMGAYQQTLDGLRAEMQQWQQALQERQASEPKCFRLLEQQAWRCLGAAVLLLDMHTRGGGDDGADSDTPAQRQRATLLTRLRRWWRR